MPGSVVAGTVVVGAVVAGTVVGGTVVGGGSVVVARVDDSGVVSAVGSSRVQAATIAAENARNVLRERRTGVSLA